MAHAQTRPALPPSRAYRLLQSNTLSPSDALIVLAARERKAIGTTNITERCLSVEYRSWKMFVRESYTAVQMAIAGICVEIHRAKYSCCIRRTSRLAGEPLRLSWATSLQEDTVLSNRPSCR